MDTTIVTTQTTAAVTLVGFIGCLACSLALGLVMAWAHRRTGPSTKSFLLTLAVIPAVVTCVIMLVNGNIGAGVAVAGAFSLVRFRSVPGTAREIAMIFLAMAVGLACGMSQLLIAAVFTAVMVAFVLVAHALHLGGAEEADRTVRISVPEDTDWEHLFDEPFSQYCSHWQLDKVKTTGMGTIVQLDYSVTFNGDGSPSPAFLDAIRTRNSNLPVSCMRPTNENAL